MALKVICTLALLAVVNAQRCLDYRNWQDFLGDSCQRYSASKSCTSKGGYGPGWNSGWGTFADNADSKGIAATKACCACGGGTKEAAAKWQCKRSSDCVHGTCRIHKFGNTRVGSCLCYRGYAVDKTNQSKGIFSCTHRTATIATSKPTKAYKTCPAATFAKLLAAADQNCAVLNRGTTVNVNTGVVNHTKNLTVYVPYQCDGACAKAYLPLHSTCYGNLASLYGKKLGKVSIQRYDQFATKCQKKLANMSGVNAIANCRASMTKIMPQINKVCCTQKGMCNSTHPVPISCTESCGAVFVPWFEQCGKASLSAYTHVFYEMRAFSKVCQREATTCSSAMNCSQLHKMYQGVGSYDSWPTSSGSNASVCGESDLAYASNNVSTLNPTCYGDDDSKSDGWLAAERVCGTMGARLCSMDELLNGEASGTGCGHDAALTWSRSAGYCGRRQHMAVAGAPGMSAIGAECRNDTESLAVRCCADATAGKRRAVCPYSRVVRPLIAESCTSASNCSSLSKRFGGWDATKNATGICGESDNGMDHGGSKCFGATNSNTTKKYGSGWYGASRICDGIGSRLCTAAELMKGAAKGTGCGYDAAPAIWASDRSTAIYKAGGNFTIIPGSTTVCAHEGQMCKCAGTVQYGSTQGKTMKWSSPKTVATSVMCTNNVFGDPWPGVGKTCQCTTSVMGTGGAWVSTKCGRRQYVAVQPLTGKASCVNYTVSLPVRCCADATVGRVCRGSRPLPIRGAAYEGCSSSMTCAQLKVGFGGWPLDTGSKTVCGESDNGISRGCVHENNRTARNGWVSAAATCGAIGARLCSAQELIKDEAKGTGCGVIGGIERVWSLTSLNCPIGQYYSVKGHIAQCSPQTKSYAVRCCADAKVNKKKICKYTNSRAKAPKALKQGDVCRRSCPNDKVRTSRYFNRCTMCPPDENGNPAQSVRTLAVNLTAAQLCSNQTRRAYYFTCPKKAAPKCADPRVSGFEDANHKMIACSMLASSGLCTSASYGAAIAKKCVKSCYPKLKDTANCPKDFEKQVGTMSVVEKFEFCQLQKFECAKSCSGCSKGPAATKVKPGCNAPSSIIDPGYGGTSDAYNGWYDFRGCGACNDYCRWIGLSGHGGDPSQQITMGDSFWSCQTDTQVNVKPASLSAWRTAHTKKCSTKGAVLGTGANVATRLAPGHRPPPTTLPRLPALQMHWLGNDTEARCMDGSRYGYYFRPASSADGAKKWVIEMQGGGWCYNEGACYGRTLPSYAGGVLGSSKNWKKTFGTYYLDDQDWNRVFLRYCSGASFTGYRREGWDASGWAIPGHPGHTVPAGTKLWFRGAANLAESIAELQANHGMTDVDELIVTGSSAGGLATTLNVDRVRRLVKPKRIAGLSDAGFFKYEHNHSTARWSGSANFSADMQHLFGMVNASGALSAKCQAAQTAQASSAVPAVGGAELPAPGPWNCLMPATAEQYVESPMFFLQSRFDHFQLGAELALPCMVTQSYAPPWKHVNCTATEVSGMREYGKDLRAELSLVFRAPAVQRGLYLSACIIHGQTNLNAWTKTKIKGVTPQQAWRIWYAGLAHLNVSGGKWVEECANELPCNPNSLSCAPYSTDTSSVSS